MNIKKHIPNFLTCCNLLCGCLGIITAIYAPTYGLLATASIYIFIAGIFDFFDGFAARILKVTSSIGKELDSLSDVISFGVLPGIIIYKLIEIKITQSFSNPVPYQLYYFLDENFLMPWILPLPGGFHPLYKYHPFIELIAMIIPIFSALRLAKFNIDTRQSESFIGVPTPTNAILVASFPLILSGDPFTIISSVIANPIFLIAYSIIMSLLLVAELPLFALKFKNFSWGDNQMKYILLIAAVVLLILLQWAAIPLIIFLYILLSFIENKILKSGKPKAES